MRFDVQSVVLEPGRDGILRRGDIDIPDKRPDSSIQNSVHRRSHSMIPLTFILRKSTGAFKTRSRVRFVTQVSYVAGIVIARTYDVFSFPTSSLSFLPGDGRELLNRSLLSRPNMLFTFEDRGRYQKARRCSIKAQIANESTEKWRWDAVQCIEVPYHPNRIFKEAGYDHHNCRDVSVTTNSLFCFCWFHSSQADWQNRPLFSGHLKGNRSFPQCLGRYTNPLVYILTEK